MELVLKEGTKNERNGNLQTDVSCKTKKTDIEMLNQIDSKLDMLLEEKKKEQEEKE